MVTENTGEVQKQEGQEDTTATVDQTQEQDNEQITGDDVTVGTEQAPAGDDSTPLQKQEEGEGEVTQPAAEDTTPVSVQDRINRMYARLQAEKRKNARQQVTTDAQKLVTQPDKTYNVEVDGDVEGETRQVTLTAMDVEQIIERRDAERAFEKTEAQVFARHPEAINPDGTFNMNDPFMKAYLDMGRTNPQLAQMTNGPLLAEAMVEKQIGIDYKKGRRDEAKVTKASNNAATLSSTTKPVNKVQVSLSPAEKKVAARMGMTDVEYAKQKSQIASGNRRIF